MIEAEMYGMMPRPKMVLWLRLPPENIEIRPYRPLITAPGQPCRAAPMRNRIRPRRAKTGMGSPNEATKPDMGEIPFSPGREKGQRAGDGQSQRDTGNRNCTAPGAFLERL